jgi:amidophosphoribosyltransferase
VKIKLNPVKGLMDGKRVITVDDSIVRGTTSRKIIKMFRNAGAKEIHVRISSPPITHPCYFGIDTPQKSELIASSHKIKEIQRYIAANSLHYLSLEGLRNCVKPMGTLLLLFEDLSCSVSDGPWKSLEAGKNPW